MKAVTITSFGGVEGLEIRDVADAPRASLDRVRVRVRAAGLNRADILQRLGRYPAPPGYPQDIPGIEFAGEVAEVGDEVRAAIGGPDAAFRGTRPGHWLLDLYAVARARLERAGVHRIYGGGFCTYTEGERFFSYRRDRGQMRMAAAIWRA